MAVGKQLGPQSPAGTGDSGDDRINGVSGGAGHEADNEMVVALRFAGLSHGLTLEESAAAGKWNCAPAVPAVHPHIRSQTGSRFCFHSLEACVKSLRDVPSLH